MTTTKRFKADITITERKALTAEWDAEKNELRIIDKLTNEAIVTYSHTFDHDPSEWPTSMPIAPRGHVLIPIKLPINQVQQVLIRAHIIRSIETIRSNDFDGHVIVAEVLI